MDHGWYQCQICGFLHQENRCFNIEDNLFVKMKCKHCRGDTKHIWVGDNPEDVYIYGNSNLDIRYFQYNTK